MALLEADGDQLVDGVWHTLTAWDVGSLLRWFIFITQYS
jgi:hypothetical protein